MYCWSFPIRFWNGRVKFRRVQARKGLVWCKRSYRFLPLQCIWLADIFLRASMLRVTDGIRFKMFGFLSSTNCHREVRISRERKKKREKKKKTHTKKHTYWTHVFDLRTVVPFATKRGVLVQGYQSNLRGFDCCLQVSVIMQVESPKDAWAQRIYI